MLKKGLTVLLAGLLAAGCFTACSGGGTPSSSSAPAPAPDSSGALSSEPSSAPEPVDAAITMWVTSTQDTEFKTQLENEFLDAHPNITFNKVVKEGDPSNEFYQAVAAGNAPDVVYPSYTMMNKYMKAGILEPLNRYVESWNEWSNYTPEYVDQITLNGNIYGVPSEIAPMMFAYNKTLFANAGITEPPKTWDEALEDAKKITDPDNQIYGYGTLTSAMTEWFFEYYVWQAGGDLTKENDDGTAELTFTDPAVIKAAEYYQKLRSEKVLPSDLTIDFVGVIDAFAQGKIGMMPFAGDWVSVMVSRGMKPEDIGLCIPPAGPSGKGDTAITGVCWSMNAKSAPEVKDAAWEYIKFFQSKDVKVRTMEDQKSLGAANPTVMPRGDINVVDIFELPQEYADVLNEIKSVGRLEFYGKADFGIYVDRAVQKILADPNADPLTEFQAAQDLAAAEVLDQFNEAAKQ